MRVKSTFGFVSIYITMQFSAQEKRINLKAARVNLACFKDTPEDTYVDGNNDDNDDGMI